MPSSNNERNVDTSRMTPVSYGYAHKKVGRARGRAVDQVCIWCQRQAAEWAYQGNDPLEQCEEREQVTRTGATTTYVTKWSANVWAYEPMCVPCHVRQGKGETQ